MRRPKNDFWTKANEFHEKFGIDRNIVVTLMEEGRKIGMAEGRDHQLWLNIMTLAPHVGLDDTKTIAKYLSISEEDAKYYMDRRS